MSSQWPSRISRNSNVAERAVVNASPLIFLARAGLIDLLQLVSSEVIVPDAVASEIKVSGESDPTARILADTSWLLVTRTPLVPTKIQEWGLGSGESSVIAWAHAHQGSEAILAKQRGHITSARQILYHCANLECICPTQS
jgi:predicted nucleic acid-binding protein